jgi:hypothetical protein
MRLWATNLQAEARKWVVVYSEILSQNFPGATEQILRRSVYRDFRCSYSGVPLNTRPYRLEMPVKVTAPSKAWTVFARSKAGIVGWNPIQDMDVCVRSFCVCVVLCLGSGPPTGWSLRRGQEPTKDCRAIDWWKNEWKTGGKIPWFWNKLINNTVINVY